MTTSQPQFVAADPLHPRHNPAAGELKLWAAVLDRTVKDAEGNVGSGVKDGEIPATVKDARLAIFDGRLNFPCRALGIPPASLQRHARENGLHRMDIDHRPVARKAQVEAFVAACCHTGDGHRAAIPTLHRAFTDWCDEQGFQSTSSHWLGRYLRSITDVSRDPESFSPVVLVGVGLLDEMEALSDAHVCGNGHHTNGHSTGTNHPHNPTHLGD